MNTKPYWEVLLEMIHDGSTSIHSESDAQRQFLSIAAWAYAGIEMGGPR